MEESIYWFIQLEEELQESVAPEGDQAQHFPYYCNVYDIITELYIIFVTIM